MSVKEIRTLLASGHMLLHKTTDAQGSLQCFSLVTTLSNFLLLAYIATDQTKRSTGVGSMHMKALIDLLKKAYPQHLGLFLEIESTLENNLTSAEETTRKRRLAFYEKLQCKRLLGREYQLPSYIPGTPPREGELLWFEFGRAADSDPTLQAVIAEIYTKAYFVTTTDPSYVKVVGQFNMPAVTSASTAVVSTSASPSLPAKATSAGSVTDTESGPKS